MDGVLLTVQFLLCSLREPGETGAQCLSLAGKATLHHLPFHWLLQGRALTAASNPVSSSSASDFPSLNKVCSYRTPIRKKNKKQILSSSQGRKAEKQCWMMSSPPSTNCQDTVKVTMKTGACISLCQASGYAPWPSLLFVQNRVSQKFHKHISIQILTPTDHM